MALKNIGIFIIVCVTLAVATEQEAKSPPEGHDDGHYHGLYNPNYPTRQLSTSEEEDIPRKGYHDHKPYFPHSSEESDVSQEKWEYKKPHHHSWNIPRFPHHNKHQKENFDALERRRPIFFPYHPYHPFYPHAHPSPNDEEFETIEALKRGTYHGSHNPNFPLAQENGDQKRPFYHGQYNPFNFDSSEESNEEIPNRPFFHIPHFKPFYKEPQNTDSESSEEQLRIPNFIIDLYNFLHNGYRKPHEKFPLNQNESGEEDGSIEEGSDSEEIIPLSNSVDVPAVVKGDNPIEDKEVDSNN